MASTNENTNCDSSPEVVIETIEPFYSGIGDRALMIIKPNVSKADRCRILGKMPDYNMTVKRVVEFPLNDGVRDRVTEEYAEHAKMSYFDDLVSFMSEGDGSLILVELERIEPDGHLVLQERLRKAIGCTDPRSADIGTLRSIFGNKHGVIRENAIHAPDSLVALRHSAKVWLGEDW